MTFAGPFPGRSPRPRPQLHLRWHPRPWLVALVLGVVVVLVLLATVGTDLLVNLLFYREVHFSRVFTTVLVTRLILFVLGAVVGGAVLATNLALGHVLRPAYLPVSTEQQALDTYREVITPARRWIVALLGAVSALAFGLYAQGRWIVVQLWLHGQSFHERDPLFHRDLSYFAFQRPFEVAVVHVVMVMVVLGFLIAAASHYFWGGLRLQTRGEKLSGAARSHLSILVGLFLLLKAMNYWLDRFGLTLSSGASGTTGADYTDVHATLQAKTILVFIALICAVLCFANAVRRGWLLAAAGLGAMVLAAFVVGFLVPQLVQQFHVKPNQINLEAPYVQRSIAATRAAYQIEPSSSGGTVDTTTYAAPAAPPASSVTTSNVNIANSRLLDPNQLQPTFEQLQQIRSYYSFPQSLDIDRYTIDGSEQAYVLATRDVNLSGLAANQHNWVNDHLVYTHGQGIVAAETGQVDANGRPVFSVGGLPESGANGGPSPIPIDQSRIYFGELSPTYSIVDTKQPEQDGTGAADYHYDGDGGVSVGSKLGTRLALALHFRDYNLLFSSSLTKSSRILYYRDPRQRVAKVAPWLTLDGDPYPAVVDGRVTWIVDGYTTSDDIPYSQRVSLGGTTTTSQSSASNVSTQSGTSINYIRNSVKATVDAYTGKVTLYAFENGVPDPVLRTWEAVFPGTVQPESAISPELRAHLRYPEDLFTVQRDLLAKYHVSDAKTFIQSSDFWQVATDPVSTTGTNQAPYYEELEMPGQTSPEFQLATSLTYNQRPNLAAFVAVSSDPSDYGEMRVLQLPDDTVLQGPANVFSSIKADPSFAQQFTLLNQNGSTFIPGNLLTLPVGGGLLFVQPYYIRAAEGAGASADSFPLLHFVVVDYGDKVGYAPTLAGALTAALSGGGSSASTSTTTTTAPTPSPSTSTSTSTAAGSGTVASLQLQVSEDFAAAKTALTAGDLGAYQAAVAKAQLDYARLLAAEGTGASTSPSARPTATPSPSPS